MTTLEAVANVFFVLWGVFEIVSRAPFTNYLMAMYPASMRPARQAVYWVLVLLGFAAIAIGASRLLRFL